MVSARAVFLLRNFNFPGSSVWCAKVRSTDDAKTTTQFGAAMTLQEAFNLFADRGLAVILLVVIVWGLFRSTISFARWARPLIENVVKEHLEAVTKLKELLVEAVAALREIIKSGEEFRVESRARFDGLSQEIRELRHGNGTGRIEHQ